MQANFHQVEDALRLGICADKILLAIAAVPLELLN